MNLRPRKAGPFMFFEKDLLASRKISNALKNKIRQSRPPKRPKYNNQRTETNGKKFHSKMEADYYDHLLRQQACGKIKIISLQEKVFLTDAKIKYIPDFFIYDCEKDQKIYLEIKGFETKEYKLKERLWQFYGPGELHVIKREKGEWITVKIIIPEIRK